MGGASFFLGDLNEYIAPGAACVLPPAPTVALSLADCLACAGCVTSAETVLVAQQTAGVVREALARNRDVWAVVAPTSRTAIAQALNLSVLDAHKLILVYLYSVLKMRAVLDTAVAERLSLLCTVDEFLTRWERSASASADVNASNGTNQPCSGTTQLNTNPYLADSITAGFPMLASECPGWVCYAEKRQAALLPHISRTRSPQQITAALARLVLGAVAPAFLFAVMPCYDKKLEAARAEHFGADVDTVVTTAELLDMVREDAAQRGLSLPDFVAHLLAISLSDCGIDHLSTAGVDSAKTADNPSSCQLALDGYALKSYLAGASPRSREDAAGGYLAAVLGAVLRVPDLSAADFSDLFAGSGTANLPATVRRVRGPDYVELEVPLASGPPLVFARVYGFRNIQTMLQRARRGPALAFVEVMACPGACLLGGGQPPAASDAGHQAAPEHRAQLEALHAEAMRGADAAGVDEEARRLHAIVLRDPDFARRVVFTSYRAVEMPAAKALHVQW